MKLIITIDLDNVAMQEDNGFGEPIGGPSGYAIGDVLDRLAGPFHQGDVPMPGASHRINDANGNNIGSITVTE